MFSGLRKQSAQQSALPLRRPAPGITVSVLLLIALLLTLGWIGEQSPAWGPVHLPGWQWLADIWNWVANVFGGAARVLTTGKDGAGLGVRLACLLLLVLGMWALRRGLLARNAHQPGPVEVLDLEDTAPDGGHKPLGELSAQLRKQLSETNLYPPSALPAEPPAESFLDLLGTVNLEPDKLGTSLLSVFSRLRPKLAYQVKGVLRTREHAQSCGVTVTVTSFAVRASRTTTIWAATWDEAVHTAGYWVMATILPVTRASKKPPWRNWRGQALSHELFAAYQEGQKMSRERRFDEALNQFYKALKHDPSNVYIRIQVAETLEQLGLHLDALDIYYSALTLGRFDTKMEDRVLWWNYYFWLRRCWYLWHWRHQSGFLLARYRFAVVLGTSEITAKQWCGIADEKVQRPSDRDEVLERLVPAFAHRYGPALVRPRNRVGPWRIDRTSDLANLLDPDASKHDGCWYERVRIVFQLAARQEMKRLCQDYPVTAALPATRLDPAITWSARRINRDVWTPLRLAWALNDYRTAYAAEAAKELDSGVARKLPDWPSGIGISDWTPGDQWQLHIRGPHCITGANDWPAFDWTVVWTRHLLGLHWPSKAVLWPPYLKPDLLEKVVRRARRPLVVREHHRHWQDHYNAACVYAIALRGADDEWTSRRFEELAFEELEATVRSAEIASVTLKRAWLLTEDPDLLAVRQAGQGKHFRRFEHEAYPRTRTNLCADDTWLDREMTRWKREVLKDLALLMENTWHERGSNGTAGMHDLIGWFEHEEQVWRQLQKLTDNKAEDWRDREDLLETVKETVAPTLLAKFEPRTGLPDWEAAQSSDGQSSDGLNAGMQGVRTCLSAKSPCSPLERSRAWKQTVQHLHEQGKGMSILAIEGLCAAYADIWACLRDILDGAPARDATLANALRVIPTKPHAATARGAVRRMSTIGHRVVR